MNAAEIKIVFEDDWILAVEKPAGLMVHANPENPQSSAEPNLQDLVSEGRKRRLVLFHRLDKDTSGIILLGKRPEIGEAMSRLFEEKKIRKAYFAVVAGQWKNELNRVECFLRKGSEGRMLAETDSRNGAKQALTTFRVMKTLRESAGPGKTWPAKTWIEAMPKTGRTHQIRVHCALSGHPILGDRLYNPECQGSSEPRLALHAHQLNFTHPITKEALRLSSPPPADWKETWLAGF